MARTAYLVRVEYPNQCDYLDLNGSKKRAKDVLEAKLEELIEEGLVVESPEAIRKDFEAQDRAEFYVLVIDGFGAESNVYGSITKMEIH